MPRLKQVKALPSGNGTVPPISLGDYMATFGGEWGSTWEPQPSCVVDDKVAYCEIETVKGFHFDFDQCKTCGKKTNK